MNSRRFIISHCRRRLHRKESAPKFRQETAALQDFLAYDRIRKAVQSHALPRRNIVIRFTSISIFSRNISQWKILLRGISPLAEDPVCNQCKR